ncbi:Disease resistance protein, partial [Mucuna pruriens]
MDSKIVESSVEPFQSQFGYITSDRSNLKTEVQNLEATKNSVQHSVDEAKRNGEVIVNWLKKVDATVAEEEKLFDNDVHTKDKYSVSHFPSIWSRNQKSKQFEKMIQETREVRGEGNFERISHPVDSNAFDYKTSILKEIKEALKDPEINMIGVHGMGGVGKTTLVKELAGEVKKDGSFGVVVIATITLSPDVENIQGQIASALGLKFDEETKEGRVGQLRQRIRRERNILVILDDICEKIDLEEVGIPFGDDHNGCKLLLTSKTRNVLKRQMGTQRDFKLEALSGEDSWKLFEKISGNVVQIINIKSIAQSVAKRCDGLPLLIVVVAKALRKKDVSTWKDALKQLEGFDRQGLFKEVICPLELSYNYLGSDELKSLFLFIVSFGHNCIHTGELFSCFWGLMGLYGYLHTLTEVRNKYYKLVNDLKASSLLLEGEIEYVRMHDAVRDMAKSIASRTHLTYEAQKFTQMEQWDMDQLKNCHYINLPSYNIDELPEKLNCPELKLMTLRRNHGYITIPDNFFSGMRNVKVLNLHGMRFTPSPPPSIRLLSNLISLNLYGCVLKDIAIVAELTSLEILTLERSEIQELPKEIGRLVYLRMLNLTNCYQLKNIPIKVLSSLTNLEELYMGNCNIQWEVEGRKSQTQNASLGELGNLNQLTTLDLSIQDASVLLADMDAFAKLQRYNIFIGSMWKWSSLWSGDARETSRTLKLTDSLNTNICLNRWVQSLFTTVEDLSLAKLNLVNDVFYELNGEKFSQLRHLHIQNSDALRNLEKLILRNLHNLEDISYSPLPTHSFEKLQVIEVHGCDKLKKLLLYSLAKTLSQLQKLEISDCEVIQEIISEEKLEDEKEFPIIMLPKLHSLTLDRLYTLRSFSSPLIADKDDVPLFNQKVTMPDLQTLELCSINTSKIWDDKLPLHSCIQNLTSLKIDSCGSLTNLFTSSVARALVKLQYLRIANCPKLENIFVKEEKVRIVEQIVIILVVTFPNLETLVISDNDNLTSIWPIKLAPNSFCKLKELQIYGTKILDHVFPISVVEELQQLHVLEISRCRIENIVEKSASRDVKHVCIEKLDVSWCYRLKTLFSSSVLFQTLDELKVDHCGGMVNIITPSIAPCIPNLRILSVSSCEMLEEIFGSSNEGNAPSKITFMKLEQLELKYLTKLTSFCNGSYNFNFPSLITVSVIYCPMMVTFCHGSLTTSRLALFNEKVAMPNLEILELSCINAQKIWDDKLPVHLYNRNLMSLTVHDCSSLTSLFSPLVVRVLYKLQHLKILSCLKLVEIFVHQKVSIDDNITAKDLVILPIRSHAYVIFPELKTLVIKEMNHLTSIWHNQQAPNSFCKLNKIQIVGCHALHHVFPIVVAKGLQQLEVLEINTSNIENIVENGDSQDVKFNYLKKLIVSRCHKLKTILQSSVLFQTPSLRILNISSCHKLEQAFANKKEGAALGEISFTKLKELKLEDLPILANFCKENFKFPTLREVHVIGCPNMKTFGHGWKDEKGQKDDDLNNLSIAFPLFNEKVEMPDLQILELFNINSRKIWDDKLPVHLYCQNLKIVKVRGCRSIVSLFSSSAARALVKLQHLEILSCPVLVNLFVKEEEVTFPTLETLVISDMKGLKSIWNDQQALNSFCKLNKIEIIGCEALHHVFPIAAAMELRQLQVLEISSLNIENIVEKSHIGDVKSVYFENLTVYKCDKLKTIVQSSMVFQTLTKLEVKSCAQLINIIMPSMSTNVPSLSILSIYGCPKLEQIFGSGDKGDAPDEIASTKLEELKSGSENKGGAPDEIASTKLEELKSGSENKGGAPDEIASTKLEELKSG